jgi:uncharacterized protein
LNMAVGSLLALLDDIATVLDDVAVLTKVAAKKTAGVLGDDLALNAQQVAGVQATRELPVVWAVAKGSFVNKLILVPAFLLISWLAPWAITPLLMLGGAYLCFEGAEKLWHKFAHREQEVAEQAKVIQAFENPAVDLVAFEKDKIKGAIRTDFILSGEIIVIALGTVATQPLTTRIWVLSAIAIVMTVGVYGFVAAIVKMDDVGLWLKAKGNALAQAVGGFLLASAPWLMRFLAVAGTAAMFLVGGSILRHGIHWKPEIEGLLGTAADGAVGVVAGALLVLLFTLFQRLRSSPPAGHA